MNSNENYLSNISSRENSSFVFVHFFLFILFNTRSKEDVISAFLNPLLLNLLKNKNIEISTKKTAWNLNSFYKKWTWKCEYCKEEFLISFKGSFSHSIYFFKRKEKHYTFYQYRTSNNFFVWSFLLLLKYDIFEILN